MFAAVTNVKELYKIFEADEEENFKNLQEGFIEREKRCSKCRKVEVVKKNSQLKVQFNTL